MKKLWGIRHIRFFYLRGRVYSYAAKCAEFGIGLGNPNPSDLNHLDLIWQGKA